MKNNDDALRYAVGHSNRIEAEPVEGPSFDNHLRAALLARTAAGVGQLLHPVILHQLLFEGLPSDPRHPITPGTYRDVDVGVAQAGKVHVFPPHQQVPALMDTWWNELWEAQHYGRPDLRQEQTRWWLHAWFESIHPFQDGNGRVGRCLLWGTDILAGQEITIITFESRHQYYQHLEDWRAQNPDWQHGQIKW